MRRVEVYRFEEGLQSTDLMAAPVIAISGVGWGSARGANIPVKLDPNDEVVKALVDLVGDAPELTVAGERLSCCERVCGAPPSTRDKWTRIFVPTIEYPVALKHEVYASKEICRVCRDYWYHGSCC